MSNKWIEKEIDWSNYKQLAKNVWLFLTNDKMPENATVSKYAFIHEVSAMIQSACMFAREEIRRVKKQRNTYEQELLLANRRLLKMKVELEIEREKRLQEENLSKESISEDELKKRFGDIVIGQEATFFDRVDDITLSDYNPETPNKCAQIAKQYSDSKLEKLEKWIEQSIRNYEHFPLTPTGESALKTLNEVKDKIQSL